MKGWATNDQSANQKNRYNLPNRSAAILALNGVSSASEEERPPSVYTDCTGPPRSGFVQQAKRSVGRGTRQLVAINPINLTPLTADSRAPRSFVAWEANDSKEKAHVGGADTYMGWKFVSTRRDKPGRSKILL